MPKRGLDRLFTYAPPEIFAESPQKNQFTCAANHIMKNSLTKTFSHYALTNVARIAAIAAACVTMSALTLPKPPSAPPAEITFNIDSTDTTDSSDSSDTTQSNLVSACVCDLNQDRTVDSADFGTLLGSFGTCQPGDPGDFNLDAAIDSSDLGTMLGNFGPCPSGLSWATVLQWNPDPDVVPDAAVRAKIVASGFPWRVLDIGTGIEMLLIPGGTFTIDEDWATPVHTVTLTRAFYLGKTEVTQAQWQAKMGSNPSYFSGNANNPVEQVSWNDIAGFNTATGLRLPSEAEWEYACRGNTTNKFHSMPGYPNGTNDDSLLGNIAWYSENIGAFGSSTYGTKPVAGKAANAFGLYDMSGNVWEWCNDWYGDYSAGNATDPTGPSVGQYNGAFRVGRGGCWWCSYYDCSSSRRNYDDPATRGAELGFRVARTADPAPTITTISPADGLTSGGTTITLNGSNFLGASSVAVGGVAATSVNVVSDSVLTAVTPPGSIGAAVSVSVTTSKGTATLASAFIYYEALSWASVLEFLPNAAVVPDAAVRANIVASGYPWRVLDTGTGIEMLLIPSGTFTMGCSASNSYGCSGDENPTHQVTLSKAFYMGKTEVTQAQWQAKMGSNPSSFKGYSDSPSRPVEQVIWNDIAGFNTATGLRLPSEAEWEYACRGGTTTAFHSMPGYPNGTNYDSLLRNIAWFNCNGGCNTHPVAGKAVNAFGMYDMSGNVWEWCNDLYGSYAEGNATDPTGPSVGQYGSSRVLRGGDWSDFSDSFGCRSSNRGIDDPDDRSYQLGFRVARTADPAPTITTISPAAGLTSGGTTITLNGSNFFGASSVTVGGVAATSVNVVSASVLTAVTPPGSIGAAVSVSVTTPGGTGTLAGAFSYYDGTLSWATVLEALPNAAVVPDAAVRANIVASGFPWRVLDTGTGIEMLLIPAGTFNMGCSASNSYSCYGDETNHQVTLSKAFYLGKTEVTQAQWQAKMGSNPSYFGGNPNNPVETVSWNDIVGFNTATGLRLPSEAEWEYACRGGTTTAFHSMPGYPNGTNDDSLLGNIAWYQSNNSPNGTKSVAGKAVNAFGMYDMSGNVAEWCNDWYGSYAAGNVTDPAGPSSGSYRVLRGGSWDDLSVDCRSSNRHYFVPVGRSFNIGFRVARTP